MTVYLIDQRILSVEKELANKRGSSQNVIRIVRIDGPMEVIQRTQE